ncbi:hypothetical protein GUJ93_ZPchr0036g6505 [Zizania palustris]|uniref:Myb-like domain-containing protein n=1 Tax=Zizania palustris TaxID=103762 RepID=A0A8J5R5V2_ZIZPA|nr:hypothetical protein GUJ93_ZPchr0036g6505 [Zizania palustris]
MAGGDSPSFADGAPPSPAPQMIEQRPVLVRIHEVRSESNGEPYIDTDGSSDTLPNVVEPRLKKGPWTQAEDAILEAYVKRHGGRNWKAVQKNTGLLSCGFSNGHFSASRSTIGPSKMEPPSIQGAGKAMCLFLLQQQHFDMSGALICPSAASSKISLKSCSPLGRERDSVPPRTSSAIVRRLLRCVLLQNYSVLSN